MLRAMHAEGHAEGHAERPSEGNAKQFGRHPGPILGPSGVATCARWSSWYLPPVRGTPYPAHTSRSTNAVALDSVGTGACSAFSASREGVLRPHSDGSHVAPRA